MNFGFVAFLQIQEKHPERCADPIALDAMVEYTKQYYMNAHCAFLHQRVAARAKRKQTVAPAGGADLENEKDDDVDGNAGADDMEGVQLVCGVRLFETLGQQC